MSNEKQISNNQQGHAPLAGVMKRGHYDVQVFDENGNEVDRRNNIVAWTRREAYFEVMNEMKLHKTWDSTRVKDHVS